MFADASGKKAGEFFTPRARRAPSRSHPRPSTRRRRSTTRRAARAACSIETINEVRRSWRVDSRTLRLYGQEVNLTTAAIARMNLFLHDLEDFRSRSGVTRSATLASSKTHGAVAASSTSSSPIRRSRLKNWGADTWANDPYGQGLLWRPANAGTADFAWVQHMVSSMKAGQRSCRRRHAARCAVPRRRREHASVSA